MAKTVAYGDFDLIKAKITKGLEVTYFDKQNPNKEFTVKSGDVPHPDLKEALTALNENMAFAMGLLSGWIFAKENNGKNEEVYARAKYEYNDVVLGCEVSGVQFVGQDKTEGIKITGSIKCENGSVGLATPSIIFAECEDFIDKQAEELSEKVKKEVWNYLFKGKKAQFELELEVNEDEPVMRVANG